MKRLHLALLCSCGGLVLVGAGSAGAQTFVQRPGTVGVPPYQGPAVSPYINLNRQGSSAGVNYYGLVRPQIDFGSSLQQLQQQVGVNQQTLGAVETEATLPTTGHPVGFQTEGRYFNTLNNRGTTVGTARPALTLQTALPRPTLPTTTAPTLPTMPR